MLNSIFIEINKTELSKVNKFIEIFVLEFFNSDNFIPFSILSYYLFLI